MKKIWRTIRDPRINCTEHKSDLFKMKSYEPKDVKVTIGGVYFTDFVTSKPFIIHRHKLWKRILKKVWFEIKQAFPFCFFKIIRQCFDNSFPPGHFNCRCIIHPIINSKQKVEVFLPGAINHIDIKGTIKL